MIASCPKCSTRYRVENERLRPEGLRLRCTRCQSVFRVLAPSAPPQALEPAVQAELTPPPRVLDRERLVLVADGDEENAKALAAALAEWGLHPLLAHDGVEAILGIQRSLPRAVVIDAALPKMFGFQVCELIKRNEQLRSIHVVLVGAIHQGDRYRREASETYGADAYLESPDLPHGLPAILERFGMPVVVRRSAPPPAAKAPAAPAAPAPPPATRGDETVMFGGAAPASDANAATHLIGFAPAAAAPAPAVTPRAAAAPVAAPAPAPAAADDGLAEERAKAQRLARIIVSDVILYNEEKFAAAIRSATVLEALDADLEEGRALFRQRIDSRVRGERDFLTEELLRVARSRGMR